jgi:NADH-quinone oxidoreductase subunit N
MISIGSFGFLTLIQSADKEKSGQEDDQENDKIFAISALAGLAKSNPVMAFALAMLMFSTAGIPPLAGFFSKFYILSAAISASQGVLLIPAILAILFSVISAYYYLRVVKIMYFDEAKTETIGLAAVGNIKFVVLVSALANLAFMAFLNSVISAISNFSLF